MHKHESLTADDSGSQARFVAAAQMNRPEAWKHVELLKAACALSLQGVGHGEALRRSCYGVLGEGGADEGMLESRSAGFEAYVVGESRVSDPHGCQSLAQAGTPEESRACQSRSQAWRRGWDEGHRASQPWTWH
jgi:hypothetical protein